MATQRAIDEADIRQRISMLAEAIRAMDLEKVMSIYAADLVSFDAEPPLRHVGASAKRKNWTKVFSAYKPSLGYEVRDLTIAVGDDVAFGYALVRISGTMTNGIQSAHWLRWTMGLRKMDDNWRIVHDQVSVPSDFEHGKAMVDLEP